MSPNSLWFENNGARMDIKSFSFENHMAPEMTWSAFFLEVTYFEAFFAQVGENPGKIPTQPQNFASNFATPMLMHQFNISNTSFDESIGQSIHHNLSEVATDPDGRSQHQQKSGFVSERELEQESNFSENLTRIQNYIIFWQYHDTGWTLKKDKRFRQDAIFDAKLALRVWRGVGIADMQISWIGSGLLNFRTGAGWVSDNVTSVNTASHCICPWYRYGMRLQLAEKPKLNVFIFSQISQL